MKKVVTYQAPSGLTIDLTLAQVSLLNQSLRWPRDYQGQEYCSVSHGLHEGESTYSDEELKREFDL